MSNELAYTDHANTGLTTYYAVLQKGATVVKASDGSSLALSSANWQAAAVALSDTGHAGHYLASVPTGTGLGRYRWKVYQASGTPSTTAAITDEEISGEDVVEWNGTAEVGLNDTPALIYGAQITDYADAGSFGLKLANITDDNGQVTVTAESAAEIAQQVGETVNTGGTGSGDTAIDHDGADGVTVDGEPSETDVMRFTLPGGGGADDVEVVAYLKADYDAGLRGSANRQGTTSTGSDGRWVAPLMLDAGTYTILGNRGGYVVAAVTVVVP